VEHLCGHLFWYIVAELLDLLSDVSKECIAEPATNHHDEADQAVAQKHCHDSAQSNRVRASFWFLYI
jgi:hypothetical protein